MAPKLNERFFSLFLLRNEMLSEGGKGGGKGRMSNKSESVEKKITIS